MILDIGEPNYSTKKLLKLIVAEYKTNDHKLMDLIHRNNSMAEKEFVRTIPFKTAEKNLKCPGISLT